MEAIATFDDLPQDLLDRITSGAAGGGGVTASWDKNRNKIVFTSATDVWESDVTPTPSTSPPTNVYLSGSGSSSASALVCKNHAVAPTHSASSITATTLDTASLCQFALTEVCKCIARQPRDLTSVVKHVMQIAQSASPPVSCDEASIMSAIAACTTATRNGSLELNQQGVQRVSLRWYALESDKKQVANRMALLLKSYGLPFDEFVRYIDRDVYMQLFSSGSIMNAMSAAQQDTDSTSRKRRRDGSDSDAGDSDDDTAKAEARDDASTQQKQKSAGERRQIESFASLDINLDSGDLLTYVSSVVSKTAASDAKMLALLHTAQAEWTKRSLSAQQQQPPSMYVTSRETFDTIVNTVFTPLSQWCAALEDRLLSHELCCHSIRVALDTYSMAPAAVGEIESWIREQLPARDTAVEWHSQIVRQLSLLRRELQDYQYLEDLQELC